MSVVKLVFCNDGNKRLMAIARSYDFLPGAQLPGTVYEEHLPLYFADQNWKEPRRDAYMGALTKYQPAMATVLDLEREDQFDEVMSWAREAALYVGSVVVIPKIFGIIERIPEQIGNADVVLGYSVPTRYAGTEVPVWEFGRRPVHLLGGSPHRQMELCHYLNVVSTDGNYAAKMATHYCQYWVPGTARYAKNRWWPTLREAEAGAASDIPDAPYEAFRRSCKNIMEAWNIF